MKIKVLIDIPLELYVQIVADRVFDMRVDVPVIGDAIATGIRLPQNHGRLIDEHALAKKIREKRESTIETDGYYLSGFSDVVCCIADTPAIIPATESEDDDV